LIGLVAIRAIQSGDQFSYSSKMVFKKSIGSQGLQLRRMTGQRQMPRRRLASLLVVEIRR
jgi:hypothetical protein